MSNFYNGVYTKNNTKKGLPTYYQLAASIDDSRFYFDYETLNHFKDLLELRKFILYNDNYLDDFFCSFGFFNDLALYNIYNTIVNRFDVSNLNSKYCLSDNDYNCLSVSAFSSEIMSFDYNDEYILRFYKDKRVKDIDEKKQENLFEIEKCKEELSTLSNKLRNFSYENQYDMYRIDYRVEQLLSKIDYLSHMTDADFEKELVKEQCISEERKNILECFMYDSNLKYKDFKYTYGSDSEHGYQSAEKDYGFAKILIK